MAAYEQGNPGPRCSRRSWTLAAACVALWPIGTACAGPPSDTEQLWLQMINRFRSNPAAELDRWANYLEPGTGLAWDNPRSDYENVAQALGFFRVDPAVLRRQFQQLQPVPPLAWSESLHRSAQYYSDLMIDRDQQSHRLDQHGLLNRLQVEGGYDFSGGGTAGENLFAFTEDIVHGHAGFVLDWGNTPTGIQEPPGHRDNLMNPLFREIGIAVAGENDPSTDVGPLVVTQHLAADFADGPFLTGVLYQDTDQDDFYSPGEGFGSVDIRLHPEGRPIAAATATAYPSGGFRLDLSDVLPGTYRAVVYDPDPVFWSDPIVISAIDENLAFDIQDPQYDIDSLSRTLLAQHFWPPFDLNADGALTSADRIALIHDVYQTYLGDSDLNGLFETADLILVLAAGQYEDSTAGNSRWATGDWDGDGDFTTGDLVAALADGGYERGPRVAVLAVPEPSFGFLLGLALVALFHRRGTHKR